MTRRWRFGLLVPSSNTVMEVDFVRNIPSEVTVHTARMYLEETTPEAEAEMLDQYALPAARDVATVRPHVVVFGCTSAGALRGNAYDAYICGEIAKVVRCPVVSTIASVREAIRRSGARQVGVITPYVAELNERIRASLEEDGVKVVGIFGMGIRENFAIAEVQPEDIVNFARRHLSDIGMDLLFVSCTNLRAFEAIPALEKAFSVPVVTSNQAVLKSALDVLATTVGLGWP
mgnify:FL=1